MPSASPQRHALASLRPQRLPALLSGILLVTLAFACLATLPWTLGRAPSTDAQALPRYNAGRAESALQPPLWWPQSPSPAPSASPPHPVPERFLLGSDLLGRSLLIRCLAGGGISLSIGLAAAAIAVVLGTLYGSLAAYLGGRTDAILMRIVDVLYGLPYVLLVVLLAVASSAVVDEYVTRSRERERWIERQAPAFEIDAAKDQGTPESQAAAKRAADEQLRQSALQAIPPRDLSASTRTTIDLLTLLFSISGVSWLTMARVIRGQVLSLKERPFIEAARALGASPTCIFFRHLLPNLSGTIIVYATLTVPQAILQESFLSFLGIGVKPPLPSWGTLAAEGLPELNAYRSHWWLLAFPCALLALTLLALNFVGEGLRERLDPRSTPR
jgi:oligopeptide transport system permease protein